MNDSDSLKRTKRLLIGALACLLGIPLFVVLHNFFAALGMMTSDIGLVSGLFRFLAVASFWGALVLCPAGAAICLMLALMLRLPVRGPRWVRLTLLVLLPAMATGIALTLFFQALSLSRIERDEAAGFNGSFEVVRSGLPVNWYVYHRPLREGEAAFSIDTIHAVDGARSVRFDVDAVDPAGGWRSPGLFQVMDAHEGQSYEVSVRVKIQGSSVRLRITSESAQSREPRTPVTEVIADETEADEWREFTYHYTVPADYDNIRFEMNVVAPGTLWIDDVRIEPIRGG
jgi:hypothetical protein